MNITTRKAKPDDNLFLSVKDVLERAQEFVSRSVNFAMVQTYFTIGKLIVENEQKGQLRADYAEKTLHKLSRKLIRHFGKGYSVDNLENMRRFYLVYGSHQHAPISETVSRKSSSRKLAHKKSETLSRISDQQFKLSWSHYQILIRIEDDAERKFFEIESAAENWSIRELKRQINSDLYTRLKLSRNKKKVKELSKKGLIIREAKDLVKDPHVLEFLGLEEREFYSESDLEKAIISKLEKFLLELGKGFFFVGRQKRIIINEKHYRIDLVFWHRYLKCFVLIDLKIGEVTMQDIGQMQMYVNYYDRKIRRRDEKKTIGIIPCREKDDKLVRITLPENNKQIFTSKFRLYFPKDEELRQVMEDAVPYHTSQNNRNE